MSLPPLAPPSASPISAAGSEPEGSERPRLFAHRDDMQGGIARDRPRQRVHQLLGASPLLRPGAHGLEGAITATTASGSCNCSALDRVEREDSRHLGARRAPAQRSVALSARDAYRTMPVGDRQITWRGKDTGHAQQYACTLAEEARASPPIPACPPAGPAATLRAQTQSWLHRARQGDRAGLPQRAHAALHNDPRRRRRVLRRGLRVLAVHVRIGDHLDVEMSPLAADIDEGHTPRISRFQAREEVAVNDPRRWSAHIDTHARRCGGLDFLRSCCTPGKILLNSRNSAL